MKHKMACKECNQDWGIMGSYLGIPEIPLLKTDGFVFVNSRTQKKVVVAEMAGLPGVHKRVQLLGDE